MERASWKDRAVKGRLREGCERLIPFGYNYTQPRFECPVVRSKFLAMKKCLAEKAKVRKLAILVLPLAVFCLTACGNSKDVTYKSGGMTHTIAQGEGSIPDEFKALIYPDAQATGSVSADGNDQEQSKFVMLQAKATAEDVSKWYQEQLQNNGWTVGNVQNSADVISISAQKKDIEMNVMIDEDQGKTTINLSLAKTVDQVPDESESENFVPNKAAPPTD